MGAKTYNLPRCLITPDKAAGKSFKEITEVHQKHFQPKPLVIAERFRFYKRNQLKTKSTLEYIAELLRLSEHCSEKWRCPIIWTRLVEALPTQLERNKIHEGSVEERLKQIIEEHAPVFKEGICNLKNIRAQIILADDAKPRFHKARPVPYAIWLKVEAELQHLEEQGILTKVEWSDWAIVSVSKKTGDSVRICGDFKVSVNPVLCVDQYPLPRTEDIFTAVAGGKHFSKIDLAQAYLQMEVEEATKKYLVINTHKGLFQYNGLVFGIASAPAVWHQAMDQVLEGVPGTQCFLDDIIVTGVDEETHLANLAAVLARLEKYGLRANRKKCEFFKDAIENGGHRIDKHCASPNQHLCTGGSGHPPPGNAST
ncbi:PREDICTED: uncharacterized protein K02A2.6-like [Cyprinodon variegatus]|uniref:uncharacterized protein K02A2.6-like n=1 Tax=Cyprinodon variegatus TaxID=28743 RepID=UPI0007429AB4|nr:PREDICTED: uncharacterized protein K02A2.6-like [Cyprinodon variegatus]